MNIRKFLTGSVVALAVIAGMAVGVSKVQAAQIPWTGENLPSIKTPVFNIYSNIPAGVGDESDFVKLRKSNGDPTVPAATNNFIDPVNDACAVGSKFDIRTYVHNGADDDYNDNGNGPSVAHGASVSMKAPLGKAGNKFAFESTISAANASTVVDTGTLNCGSNVRLKLVPSTVKVYSTAYGGWLDVSDSAVNGNLPIGSPLAGSGDQWGCWQYRIVIVYTVEVEAVPIVPVVLCNSLVANSLGERKFRYTVNYTAQNATFKNVKYDFGDGTTPLLTTNTTVEHQYSRDGNFTTTTMLTFDVEGRDVVVTDAKCATTVSATTPPKYCPIPGKTNLPENSPECKSVEYCPIPGKTHLPVNSPECVIPNTGMGELFGLFTATTVAGAAAHYVFTVRRTVGL